MTPRRHWAALAMVALGATLAACGGTSALPSPSQPPATTGTSPASSASPSPSSTPGPKATESNPPGDIPDNQVYVVFTPPGSHISVKVPEGWARSTVRGATLFTDKLNRIQIALTKAGSAPTVGSVTSTDVAMLRSTVPKFALGKITAGNRSAGPVILATYEGDSPQDPVTGKVVRDAFERYSYYRSGMRLDLTLSGPTNADNVDPWRLVSDSVRWK
jgi:hypothetical protein